MLHKDIHRLITLQEPVKIPQCTHQATISAISDLHEKPCEQGSLDVDRVASAAKGGRRDRQLDSPQRVGELGSKSIGRQQGSVVKEEVLTPLLFIAV